MGRSFSVYRRSTRRLIEDYYRERWRTTVRGESKYRRSGVRSNMIRSPVRNRTGMYISKDLCGGSEVLRLESMCCE
jgi:hypothetical protein